MTKVTKEEAAVLRQRAPQAHIAIVNRQSSHKKYYVEENRETLAILRELRGEPSYAEKTKKPRERHRGNSRNSYRSR